MGSFSIWHWLIVLLIVLVLFGRGRVAEIMGDFGKGIKSFKQGMSDEENKPAAPPAAQIPAQPAVQPTPHPQQATRNGETVVDASETVR
jgi:sec-independent protein translocase protein TatA